MHKLETLTFDEIQSLDELPRLRIDVVDCPRCHWKQVVPAEYTDWKQVAETYRAAYKRMVACFFAKLEEAATAYDVPLVEYFDVDRQLMLSELQEFLKRGERGEQWKDGHE
jgi:hypothetical protein